VRTNPSPGGLEEEDDDDERQRIGAGERRAKGTTSKFISVKLNTHWIYT